ncbi:MAG: pseudouridine synthase [Pseudomonadota bacterium]
MHHKDKKITNQRAADNSLERLQKAIAESGLCSRRKAEEFIREGKVIVNGEKITKMGVKVNPFTDEIKVDGKKITVPRIQRNVHLVLNKPAGYITSLSDPFGRPIVMDLLPKDYRRLIPVGRLDYNTEGILLFTDDGELVHRLTHPSYGIKRLYLVRTSGIIEHERLEKVAKNGIFVDGVKLKDIGIKNIRYSGSATWFEIELGEGRNREVRRIVETLGSQVSRLKRTAYGPVFSGIPPKGHFRTLTPSEIKQLYTVVKMGTP